MNVDHSEFNHLLDPKPIESMLTSVADMLPQALFVMDSAGNILASARSIDIPDDLVKNLDRSIDQETVTSKATHIEIRHPIKVKEQQIGYVVGISTDQNQPKCLTTCVRLISQMLSDQAYKEYELNSLTTELLDKYEELNLLYELSQDLGVIFDIRTICDVALERALEVVKAKKAFIALMNDDEKYLTVTATRNINGFIGWQIPVGKGISGYVAETGRQISLHSRDTIPSGPGKRRTLYEAVLSVPLILPAADHIGKDQVLGVMTLIGKPPGDIFTAGEAQLATTIMTQVTVAIHNSRLVQALQNTERVQQQMEIASRIQQSLLPKQSPQLPDVMVAGRCLPTAKVGGDYYDFLTDEDGRLTLLIADASGHSIGSALMIAIARSILRHEITRGRPLDRMLINANRAMLDDLVEAEMFISLFCARYDPGTHQLTFVNAGHNPPLLQRAANGQTLELNAPGLILGVLEDVSYQEQSVTLDTGDILLLYTDGVIEARNPTGQQFGEQKLQKLLKKHRSLPPDELREQIYRAIRQHTQNADQRDDITLLILKVQDQT